MMKIFILFTCFALYTIVNGCEPLWYNHCTKNSDCCSGLCFMGEGDVWREGVCKPQNNHSETSNCLANWNNKCHSNDDCCSRDCFMGKTFTWRDGVCLPPNSTIIKNCLPDWTNNCTNSIDCCNGYCDKGPKSDWILGVCQSREVPGNITIQNGCHKNWYNKCQKNFECCSNYCFMGPNNQWKYGICKEWQEIGDILPQNSTCKPMFYDGCKTNSDCCHSLLCDKKPGVKKGTCKPYTALKILNEDNEWIECFENWYEYCTYDEECCSGICQQLDLVANNTTSNFTSFGVCVPDIRIIPVELVNEILANHSMNGHKNEENHSRTKRSTSVADKKVICYLGSWANYKLDDGKFVIEDIDPNICTHVVYGFAKLESNEIVAFDPWLDLSKDEPGGGLDAYARFTTGLKEKNPSLKTLIAIGGWNEGSEKYSAMVSSENTRKKFTDSVVAFLEKYNFDGFDLDWEYPSTRGGNAANDKDNLNHLLRLLHSRLSDAGKMLTMAVAANPRTVVSGYDVPTIVGLVDYISVMSYDYHGAFDNYTGHNAPLYGREDDEDLTFNVAFGINFWLANGVPPEKLIMGLPLYGRTVKLKDSTKNGIGESAIDTGDGGIYSNEPGVLYYREICQNIDNDDWIKEWDPNSLVPYMHKDDQWISYDNEQSLAIKVQFAMQANLGGIMFWSLEGDDYANKCNKGPYSLLKAAKDAMSNVIDYQNNEVKREEEKRKEEDKYKDCSESGADSVVIISQLKSAWEWLTGKSHCAKRTQERFVDTAPGISQIKSAVQAISGDSEGARQTQIKFLKNLESQIDGIPVLGHAKAAVHCAIGELDKCKEVALSATRPVLVVAGGVAGGVVGGPAGAIAGGIAGGTAFDGIQTGIESAINKKYTPQGNLQTLEKYFDGSANPSEQFDTVFGIVGDGLGGLAGGKLPGGKSNKKIGIKKDKDGESQPKKNSHCRRKRANGPACIFFNEIEDFKPVPGLRVTSISDGGPIKRIQQNSNANNRIEYVDAHITKDQLQIKDGKKMIQKGTGSETVPKTRQFQKDMNGPIPKGFESNDAGHIIANQLGGTGKNEYNIIPQSSHFNRGTWKTEVEGLVYKEVLENGSANYVIKPQYASATATRPHKIHYRIESGGRVLENDIDNPVINKNDLPFLRDVGN